MLRDTLTQDSGIDVVGAAHNGEEALNMIGRLDPDVVTLDVTMPVMDGLTALRRIMTDSPRPCVMVSALTQEGAQTTLEALQIGAVDFIAKPSLLNTASLQQQAHEIVVKVKAAVGANVLAQHGRRTGVSTKQTTVRTESRGRRRAVVAVGASTGGPRALMDVIPLLPADLPVPVLVVQHMPAAFTGSFAARLNDSSKLTVREASSREALSAGTAYVAPGGIHMCVAAVGRSAKKRIILTEQPEAAMHRPSVDVMMQSVADVYGADAVGVLLTGMGADGAEGMVAIRRLGGETIAQDEQSCVIFGMPNEAIRRGGARTVLPLEQVASAIVEGVAA